MSSVPPTEPSGLFNESAKTTSGLSIAALVLGIIALPTSCVGIGVVLGLVALILGIVALNQIGSGGNRVGGRGFAIAGIVLGSVSMSMVVVSLLIGIMLPALGAARKTARQMQNNTQLRGIHQAMVMYAQGNKGWFPGVTGPALTPIGAPGNNPPRVDDATVEGRLQILLDQSYFTGEYAVSPSETLTTWTAGPVTSANYSYAMLEITQPGGRQNEWRETLNTEAVALSDRNAGSPRDVFSVHTAPGDGWRGGVAYNDNHVVFESTHVLTTRYQGAPLNPADDLFTAVGTDDALMIHSGSRP